MRTLLIGVIAATLPLGLVACGSAGEAGAEACTVYQEELADSPEAIASTTALTKIKGMLSDLDDPTRRAFADLITAADANPYMPGADPDADRDAAAAARSVCLSEHGIEIASP